MRKELRPVHDNIACEVCGRTILKGERTETFLAPGGQRHTVCDLCFARAEHHGWIREAAAGEMPARFPHAEPRRPFFGRLFRRSGEGRGPQAQAAPQGDAVAERLPGADGAAAAEPHADPGAFTEPVPDPGEPEPHPAPPPRPPDVRPRPKDPRHVRAVPTTAEVKVERALELFNGSEHQRTISGLARTLGPPWATAAPDTSAPSQVNLLVAWELSWYRFRVDLGDEADPIALVDKGQELGEIDESLRAWNATLDAEGRLVAGVGSEQ